MSLKVRYQYRCAGNYKYRGSLIFSNPNGTSATIIFSQLRQLLGSDMFFVAHQVGVPELFHLADAFPNEDDHSYHELISVEYSEEPTSDSFGRTVEQFLSTIEKASLDGWDVFDVAVGNHRKIYQNR